MGCQALSAQIFYLDLPTYLGWLGPFSSDDNGNKLRLGSVFLEVVVWDEDFWDRFNLERMAFYAGVPVKAKALRPA